MGQPARPSSRRSGSLIEPALGWTYLSREALARAKAQMDEESMGVRDEIGFLTIHQGYADRFFPGTSVLHTRARYAVFVPWLRLHEKGGKHHVMPCHHAAAEALHAYIAAAGIGDDRKGWLFRTSKGHHGVMMTEKPLHQDEACDMVRRRAKAAGILAPIGNHSFRATGITAYLANGGTLEHAQATAAHESPRTTKLYDRNKEKLTQDEVERIRL